MVMVSADPGAGGIPAAAVRVDRESAGWLRLLAATGPVREAAQRPDLLDLGAEPVVVLAQPPLRLGRAQLIHVIDH